MKIELKHKFVACILSYGIQPVLMAKEVYEAEQEYELCSAINEAIEYINALGGDLPHKFVTTDEYKMDFLVHFGYIPDDLEQRQMYYVKVILETINPLPHENIH